MKMKNNSEKSIVIKESGPLRWKSQTNGVPKLQGVFRFKDETGFPVSITYDVSREREWDFDWIEALVDATRQNKFDSMFNEVKMIVPEAAEGIKYLFILFIMDEGVQGDTIKEKAECLYKIMHSE
jgi:hypothetical protein